MQPIYCRQGAVVGWLDEYLVLDASGYCRAYMARRLLFNQRGRHIGFIEQGLVRDRIGEIVAFFAEAAAAVPDSPPQLAPGRQPVLILPQSFPKLQDIPVNRDLFDAPAAWSALDWDGFLRS